MPKSTKYNCLGIRMVSIFGLVLCLASGSGHAAATLTHVGIPYPSSSPYYPIVLKGENLPGLEGTAIDNIYLYALHEGGLTPIPYQIDRKDKNGLFQFDHDAGGNKRYVFDKNDECVFMAADLGQRADSLPNKLSQNAAVEIEIMDPKTGKRGWVYALVIEQSPPKKSSRHYVSYHRDTDVVESSIYRIGFGKDKPMLITEFSWMDPETGAYSPNLIDTMKIRHSGNLLGAAFLRTESDYLSKLVDVKVGPVRVIRRTANKVRILWYLRTPTINIDYIHYGNYFEADTIIDVPFPVGWFFSNLVTTTTIDGNNAAGLPQGTIYGGVRQQGMLVDGIMSEEEKHFNETERATDFVLANKYGTMVVGQAFEKGFPIRSRVSLIDDVNALDPPERIPGQFGNVGFYMTNWEKMDTSLHHLVVRIFISKEHSVPGSLELLRQAPAFVY
ncbi:MAG: hypothetical protein ACYDC8_16010 [Gammaproteobacteria bacterium]